MSIFTDVVPGSRWRDRAHLSLGGLRLRPRERRARGTESVSLESCSMTDGTFGGPLDAGTIPRRLLVRPHSLSRR